MADSPKAKGKSKGPSKKLGPLPTWGWVAGGVATFGVYYIYKKHAANVAASTPATGLDPNTGLPIGTSAPLGGAAVDPNTGVPFSQETGSNAIDPLTGQTYAGIPFSVELQNAIAGIPGVGTTGSTTGTTTGTTDTTTGATTGTTTTPTTPSTTGLTPAAFTQGLVDQLTKAYGPGTGRNFSLTTINDQVNKYLNGQALTNSVLAQGIKNVTGAGNSLGAQAIATGGIIKPVITSPATTTVTHTPSEVVTTVPVTGAATTPPKSIPVPAPTGGANGGFGVIAPGKPLTNTATKAQSTAFVTATKPSTTQADRLANTPNPTGITGTLITGPLQAAPQTAANLVNTFVVGPAAAAGNFINTILGF